MKRFLLATVVVVACVLGLSFYMGWIGITSDSTTGNYSITFMVDREKFQQDEKKAVEKIHGVSPSKE